MYRRNKIPRERKRWILQYSEGERYSDRYCGKYVREYWWKSTMLGKKPETTREEKKESFEGRLAHQLAYPSAISLFHRECLTLFRQSDV